MSTDQDDHRFRDWFLDQSSDEWQQLHNLNSPTPLYTASMIPNILGIGYVSPNIMYQYMTGKKIYDMEAIGKAPPLTWGKLHEKDALAEFVQKYPHCIVTRPGLVRHKDHDYVAASLDGLLLRCDDSDDSSMVNLEIKCPYSKHIPFNRDEVHDNWLLQTQIQMACAGESVRQSYLWIWTPDKNVMWIIPRQQKLIDFAIKEVREFDCIVKGFAPPPEQPSRKKNWQCNGGETIKLFMKELKTLIL